MQGKIGSGLGFAHLTRGLVFVPFVRLAELEV